MLGNKSKTKFYRTGGSRGGASQFKWEDVKADKDRLNYLGNSQMAPTGLWQRGKDILWYTKEKEGAAAALAEERRTLKERDDDMIGEALGVKSKRKREYSTALDPVDVKQYLSKGALERGGLNEERVMGLGAAPARTHEHIATTSYLEKEIMKLKAPREEEEGLVSTAKVYRHSSDGAVEGPREGSERRERRDDKEDAERRRKKEKKERKAERRERRRSRSRSHSR